VSVQVGQPLVREAGLADRVVAHITAQLLDGTLPRGTKVPPERVLAEQFGVSRTVIREAVRTLVSKGLMETRGGSGTYVRAPDAAVAAESMSLLLRLHHGNNPISYEKIHEVRRVLEVEIAALTAKRATPEAIAALEAAVERLRGARHDREAFVSADVAFHAALAAATGNELFPVLLNSIADVMAEVRYLGFTVPGAFENAIAFHEQLLAAVRAGDEAAAVRAMKAHLRDSERALLRGLLIGAAQGIDVLPRAAGQHHRGPRATQGLGDSTLPQVISAALPSSAKR
jgi:GntR family transcriptional repressor for pyruvate dehydrogenase complex